MKLKIVICLLGFWFGLAGSAHADWRGYVWTYEYMTMRQGSKEIEYYFTAQIPDASEPDINALKHYLELEYGISERWDIALYQRLKQQNKENEVDFKYDGFKVRTRYRFGEKGQYLLDPLVYLEYIRENDFSKPHVLEEKFILAKDIGKFNFAYNQILKQELEADGKTEHEYAWGLSYRLRPLLKVGLESKGNFSAETYYLGPTVSFAGRRWWGAFGVAFGLNRDSDDIQTRLIWGMPF